MKYLFILLSLFLLFSCEKVLFKKDLGSVDPLENFDYLWNEVDQKYSYFELKNINWNQIRSTYRPMLNENSSEEELFTVLAAMLNELKDDHTNLITPFNVSSYMLRQQVQKIIGTEQFKTITFLILGEQVH